MFQLSTGLTILFLAYALSMFSVSRRRRRILPEASSDLFFVFLVPCLNEEMVIGASIDRLLALPGENYAVLVIDDGSSDRTADIARARCSERVWLLQRELPNARKGKGAALNHAIAHLRQSGLLGGHPHDKVVVAVVDADGRIEPDVLFEVSPYLRDPEVGAVQIGVRMYNAADSMVARMQDFEFVTYTEVFQRARHQLGSSGLGGNGQFNRLTALESLGEQPWTDCLTEDLDLGIRLLALGWRNAFCPTTWVSQEALVRVRRLVTQRGRWFQGHLQCWRRIGMVMRAQLPLGATMDLLHILLSPVLVLFMSLSLVAFVGTTAALAVTAPAVLASIVKDGGWSIFVVAYLLSFGMAFIYGFSYWLQSPRTSIVRAVFYGHLYVFYNYIWFVAGWKAMFRIVRRRNSWHKTERVAERARHARGASATLSATG